MVVALADVARRLRELIAALDRRAPRAGHPAEAGIARDAAFLREQAVTRLDEIAAQRGPVRAEHPDHVDR